MSGRLEALRKEHEAWEESILKTPRYDTRGPADEQYEVAAWKLVLAALDQRSPSQPLVRALNKVLRLCAHPLQVKP